MNQEQTASFFKDVAELFTKPNAFRMVLILITALILSYWLSRFLARERALRLLRRRDAADERLPESRPSIQIH